MTILVNTCSNDTHVFSRPAQFQPSSNKRACPGPAGWPRFSAIFRVFCNLPKSRKSISAYRLTSYIDFPLGAHTIEKKVQVALDWTIDLFFPRDIVVTSALDIVEFSPAPQDQAADDGPDRPNTAEGAE